MTSRLFTSAALAGLAAGLMAAALQIAFLVPLLLEGELYETGARIHFGGAGSVGSDAGAPGLWEEPARHALTLAFNVVAQVGFALLLVAGFALAERAGHAVTARQGALWGLAGFAAVQLAPAAGLPPELPGTVAADLAARQVWWISTIACTATGLAMIAFGRGLPWALGGAAVLLAPHVIGAPHLGTYFGIAPPELSAEFAARSLAVAAAVWLVLGLTASHLWARPAPAPLPA